MKIIGCTTRKTVIYFDVCDERIKPTRFLVVTFDFGWITPSKSVNLSMN